ncbi:hypothetical protein DPMN_170177 [Dreissena polymorpha]|uniref:Uncharacterized protein n=1 Tax=Dreissena polymorpha TaxID=45954 RepID=A0A9D4DY46_DREPO|nr:hypothetical protein DPMN_170177 [Dreissena polymorpha]
MKLILLGSLAVLLVWSSSAFLVEDVLDDDDGDAPPLDKLSHKRRGCLEQCAFDYENHVDCRALCMRRELIASRKRATGLRRIRA